MSTCRPYNNVIDVSYVPTEGAAEPVTIEEAKRHLNLMFDTDGSYEFNDDDTQIQDDLAAARAAIEKYTGVLLRANTVTAIIRNDKGGQELPYGPVTSFTSLANEDGDAIEAEDYKLQGLGFQRLKSPCYSYMTATYSAGYTPATIPADLKKSVLHQLAFLYDYRGGQQQQYASSDVDMSPSAKRLAQPYRRLTWLL